MGLKYDIVTAKKASKAKIIIGVQVGLMGYVLRIGLYREA